MTAALAAPAPAGSLESRRADGRLTLEEALTGALEAARVEGRAICPLCAGPMLPEGDSARCESCGSALG
jgi:DnaJ-class molecular chaperone